MDGHISELKTVKFANLTTPTTTDWTSLGGALRGTPAPITFGGTVYAFTRDTDNTLGMCTVGTSQSGGATGSWAKLGGVLQASPAAAVSPNGTVGVLALLNGNVIGVNYVNPYQGSQTGFSNIAGGTPSGVTWVGTPVLAVNSNNRLEAFSMTTAGYLYHCYQTSVGTNPTWSNWSPLANTFLTNASFQVFLNSNSGQLIATAIGLDNYIYQIIQYASGGRDGWSAPQRVGSLPTATPQFILGTAANFSTSANTATFSAYNSASGVGNNPLMFSSTAYNSGIWSNLTLSDNPISTAPPVMLNNLGTPQLVYQSSTTPGQVILLSQTNDTGFWSLPVPVGSANMDLSGQMSGLVSQGNAALFQCGNKSSLYFMNQPEA